MLLVVMGVRVMVGGWRVGSQGGVRIGRWSGCGARQWEDGGSWGGGI